MEISRVRDLFAYVTRARSNGSGVAFFIGGFALNPAQENLRIVTKEKIHRHFKFVKTSLFNKGGFNFEVQSQSSCGIPVFFRKEYLMRCFKMECFSRAMIELMHDGLNLVIGYILKAAAFGKVLPD